MSHSGRLAVEISMLKIMTHDHYVPQYLLMNIMQPDPFPLQLGENVEPFWNVTLFIVECIYSGVILDAHTITSANENRLTEKDQVEVCKPPSNFAVCSTELYNETGVNTDMIYNSPCNSYLLLSCNHKLIF